jgi:6-hydroxytryprostatin B O-methyltransferase
MAMTTSLFHEQPSGTDVRHSNMSAFLAENDDAYSYATYMCSKTAPMSMGMTEAHKRWGASMQNNETAYNAAFDTELPFFDHLSQDKTRMDAFARYMQSVRSSEAVALRHLVEGLDLRDIPAGGIFVDVSRLPIPKTLEEKRNQRI